MAKVYAIDGFIPVVDPSAFVHPEAILIGDVIVGPRCYVGPGASLRGDMGRLVMGEGANLQDNCVVHGFPGSDTTIEAFVGALALVRAGFIVPPRKLAAGMPARIVRDLSADEIAWKSAGTREYQDLARRCLA